MGAFLYFFVNVEVDKPTEKLDFWKKFGWVGDSHDVTTTGVTTGLQPQSTDGLQSAICKRFSAGSR